MNRKIGMDSITISIVFFVTLSLMIVILFVGTSESEVHASIKDGEVFVEELDSESQNQTAMEEESIYFPQYDDIMMTQNADFIPITLYNPIENPCKFKYYACIQGQDDILFESDWVKAGNRIQGIPLHEKMTLGDYIIDFYVVTESTQTKEKMNSGMIRTKLTVQ